MNLLMANMQRFNLNQLWNGYHVSSQITNMKKLAKGGFGIIYQATWLDGSISNSRSYRNSNETVILKRFKNSQDISKHFLNEVNILIFILFIYCEKII